MKCVFTLQPEFPVTLNYHAHIIIQILLLSCNY